MTDKNITRPVDELIEALWLTAYWGYDEKDPDVRSAVYHSALKVMRDVQSMAADEYPHYRLSKMVDYAETLFKNCNKQDAGNF